jgi:hypothetical protein
MQELKKCNNAYESDLVPKMYKVLKIKIYSRFMPFLNIWATHNRKPAFRHYPDQIMAVLAKSEFLHSVEVIQFHIHFQNVQLITLRRNMSFIELTPVQPGNFLCLKTETSQVIKPLCMKCIN